MDLWCVPREATLVLNQASAWASYVFLALLFASSLLGTPIVLWLYRRRVVKLMSARDEAEGTTPVDAVPGLRGAPAAPVPAERLVAAVAERTRTLRNVLVAAAAVYAVLAGLLVTLSPSAAPTGAPEAGAVVLAGWKLVGVALLDSLLVGALGAPIVLIGISHPRFARLYWRRVAPAIVLCAATRFALSDPEEGAFLGAMFFALVFVALLYLAVARRHARHVGPVLAALIGTVLAGFVLTGVVITGAEDCMGDIAFAFVVLAMLVVLVGFFWLAWRAARALGRLYERKAISDAQVQMASWLLVLTAIVLVAVISVEQPGSRQWLAMLFGVALAAGLTYALGIRRIRAWPQPQSLLLLRVFAHDERGEVLLDGTAFRWRFVGPIHMIGGPDMAQQTLDPHELLSFLRGRAREQFITTRAQLLQRLETFDEAPDPDGRYRVNEFFCFENVWQAGVAALLGRCHAVLLDLRGFTAARAGTAFEIGLLAREGALARTVCLVDEQTDLAQVERTIAAAGHGALADAQVLPASRELDAERLFAALAGAAARPRGEPAGATAG